MGFIEEFENLSSGEKELFQRVCRRLLKTTFIVREKNEDYRKLYFFASKNEEMIRDYLGFMGFDIILDKENGVVMIQNSGIAGDSGKIQANRFLLKKDESIVLCCLWLIYLERARRGNINKFITISMLDLQQELERFGARDRIQKKGEMKEILATFKKFNLIEVEGEIGGLDCAIRIYPSIQFALDMTEFSKFVESASGRLMNSKDVQEESEEIDEEGDDYEE